MNNLSTIATYLSRVSGQLQPMLEKVQGMDRRTFLLEAAALLALTSCAETSGKAGPAPMISFTPSSVITMHNTENPSADAMQHARALNNGALRCNWHYTVDPYVTMQHLPLNETGRHADRGGPGDMYSIGIEMCEKRGQSIVKTFDRAAKLAAYTMYSQNIPLRNVVPHYYWTGKRCPHLLLDNGKPGFKWSWFISRVDYYHRCIS